MNAGDLLALFRKEVNDKGVPYLWDDDLVYLFMDDAQKMFCRLTEGIPDSTTDAITKIAIVAATDTYDLSPLVLKVRSARRIDTGKPLTVINIENMADNGMFFDGRPAPVTHLITGMDKDKIVAWPLPSENMPSRLSVYRLPLAAVNDAADTFEIPDQHVQHLLMWVKHRAYGVHDAEQYDAKKTAEYETAFRAYCATVKLEQERARHHTRVVAYGGIPMNSSDLYARRARW